MSIANAKPRDVRWRHLGWKTRLLLLATHGILLLAGLEVLSRLFWSVHKKVPPLATGNIFFTYFPEWGPSGVAQAPRDRHDDVCDVLILGPSVWHAGFGDLGPRLRNALEKELGRKVRVFNLSYPGRTSRDALLLYRRLADCCFDLVVVYHSINDQYMNNIPADRYRHDYSHASRFEQLALVRKHPEHSWFVLPLTLRCLKSKMWDGLGLNTQPDMKFRHLAVEPKTAPDFRGNIEKILTLARQRGDRVLLTTFVSYIPPEDAEDYVLNVKNIGGWGTPRSVRRCLDVHNDILRDLAAGDPNVLFADLDPVMTADEKHFVDCCHLTPVGCERFIDLLMPRIDWTVLK